MKRIVAILLGGLLLLAMVHTAFAWEFTMKGEFEYRYRYFSRIGDKDLYGRMSLQDTQGALFVGMAGPAWYEIGAGRSVEQANSQFAAAPLSNVITRGGFSRWSNDARITDMKMTLYPTIKVNPAIEIYLALNIGGFRNKYAMWEFDGRFARWADPLTTANRFAFLNYPSGAPPLERYYMSQTSDAATNTASLISVDEFKFAVQVPFGMLSFGTKNFPLGTGATFARNTREESIYILVPYGPINFRGYLFPSEPPRLTGPGSSTDTDNVNLSDSLSGWGTGPDGEAKSRRFIGCVVQYQAADLDIGVGLFNRKLHLPRGYQTDIRWYTNAAGTLVFGEIPFWQLDRETYIGLAWSKFNNGRFFGNVEYAFSDSETNIASQGSNTVTPQSPKYDMLGYHAFAEAGVFSGPAKLSLMYAQASGNVFSNRRWGITPEASAAGVNPWTNGVFAGRPNQTKWYVPYAINYQVLEPYNYLIFNTYGGGNSTFNSDGTGEMSDAIALAGRLDYAVAANLNVFGSFMYAKRLEANGTLAGAYGTRDSTLAGRTDVPAGAGVGAFGNQRPDQATAWKLSNLGAAGNPWIDDNLLGWEADAGLTWQLLEGLIFDGRYAYWQPGKWFDMAYKTYNGALRADPATGSPSPVYGADLMRGRSPIQAITMSLKVNF